MLPGTGWATPRLCQRLQRYPQTSGSLAHRVEQGTFNPKVPGSSPGRPTTCWPYSPYSPMSSFHRSGCSAMKAVMSSTHTPSSKTSTMTPWSLRRSSGP